MSSVYNCILNMRAVCSFGVILITIFLIRNGVSAGHSGSGGIVRRSVHDHHSEENAPFTQVNIYLTETELEEWQHGVVVRNISYEDTESMVKILQERFECDEHLNSELCQECRKGLTDSIFEIVTPETVTELSEDEFREASAILFYLFSRGDMHITCNSATWFDTVDEYVKSLMATEGSPLVLTEDELGTLLDKTASNYHAVSYSKCFNFISLFHDHAADHDGAIEDEVFDIASFVVSYLLQGFCIGAPTILDPEVFVEDIFQLYGSHGVIPEAEFEEMLTALSIGTSAGHDHDHAHKRSLRLLSETKAERFRRAADHDHGNVTILENVNVTCFNGEELLDIHGVDHEVGLTEQQFIDTCPSLVQQILRGSCSASTETTVELTPEAWIYGTIAVLIVSLAALLGGLLIPCCPPDFYEKFILTLISLAVAVLVGDAIIHLLPLALGLHVHEGETVHSPKDPEMAYIWKSFLCLMAVYLFYLLETIMGWWSGHEHTDHQDEFHMEKPKQPENGDLPKSHSEAALADNVDSSIIDIYDKRPNILTKYGPLPVMIVLGDGLHNFGDGLAVGAAFAAGIGSGVSTSLAVLCHEVPHELGDLAILLKSGIKLKWALLLNFLSALSAFVGLYIGLALASTETARQWIFAITAGMFLYVALADMMPQITRIKTVKDPITTFCLQNVAFLIGAGFILVIALYEDAINIAI